MASRLRCEFSGAVFHVYNRGNYRRDIFQDPLAAEAFRQCLFEASGRMRWRLHAFAIMRNHYHLALTLTDQNLSIGMQWLQSTFAVRFNRFRREHGHLFQGRYCAEILERSCDLARVVNYIHLNPIKARASTWDELPASPATSLASFASDPRPPCLECEPWLSGLLFEDNAKGWAEYLSSLKSQVGSAGDAENDRGLLDGWATGTAAWKRTIATERSRPKIPPGRCESREARSWQWTAFLDAELVKKGKSRADLALAPKGADWKIAIAAKMRRETGATNRWIARELSMGASSSVSQYVTNLRRRENMILEA